MSDLNEFVVAQHATNLAMTGALARIEQSQKDMSQRLFGGDGQKGALPYFAEKDEKQCKENDTRFEKVETRVGSLETWKLGNLKWIGGAVAVLTAEGTALAFYFNHIASKVPQIVKFPVH